jgi:magnesium transporter
MLTFFAAGPEGLQRLAVDLAAAEISPRAIWVDLIEPTAQEEKFVEDALHINVPTRDEMREIEASARLYDEDHHVFMTATVVTKLDTELPEASQVTFILSNDRLVTNRYVDPLPFRTFISYAEKHPSKCNSPSTILTSLLEALVNRLADVLEKIGVNLDAVSGEVFTTDRRRIKQRNFNTILERIGSSGDVNSKARESLMSLGRLLAYVQQSSVVTMPEDQRTRSRVIAQDVAALIDHASFLANKITFLLDATLGMVNIEQNNIIKIFSVVTVFLLPPSLIAGIFGMNFHSMPLLSESSGFWLTAVIMVVSALLPYFYFKRRGWL